MSNKLELIGKRIQDSRKRKKLTQSQLAEIVGCSVAYMSDIECGKTNMGISTLIGIIEALDLSADWLIRANTTASNEKSKDEFTSILNDCSSSEIEIILATVKNLKESLMSARNNEG